MNRTKRHVGVVILGEYDSGKTTLAGHLIYTCGVIDHRMFKLLEDQAIQVSV